MIDSAVTVDGRTVALTEHGDPAGAPVFLFHGVPDSRLGKEFADAPARERGLRVLCPDRGGIGGSDPVPGRTIAGMPARCSPSPTRWASTASRRSATRAGAPTPWPARPGVARA